MAAEPELPAAFAPLFAEGTPYLAFLHVYGASRSLALLRAAIAESPDLDADLRALLQGYNWRPHLVAAAAMVVAGRGPIDALWARIAGTVDGAEPADGGSWVVPQLAAAASVIDPDYAITARLHLMRVLDRAGAVEDGHWLLLPTGKVATSLAAFLDHPPPDPRYARLAEADARGDHGAVLATGWLTRLRAAMGAPAAPAEPAAPEGPPLAEKRMRLRIVDGDLLDQDVDVIVNGWNAERIWGWLLLPQRLSGAIRRRGGHLPFEELGGEPIPPGTARITTAGRLRKKAIVHVAGIDMTSCGWEAAVSASVESAVSLTLERGFRSMAFPVRGAWSGLFLAEEAVRVVRDTLERLDPPLDVVIVRWPG